MNSHTYSVVQCPDCLADLTSPGGVEVHYMQGQWHWSLLSRLLENGRLGDADGLVAAGLHSKTECAVCGCELDDYETDFGG